MRTHFRALASTLAAAALGLNAGCYTYNTFPVAESPPGGEVKVTLSEQGAAELTRFLGPRAMALEGHVVTRSDSAVTLSVTTITRTSGVEETWPGDQVVIPRSAVAVAQSRKLSFVRSALVTAGIIAAGIAIGAGIASGADVNTGGPRPPGGGQQ